jgi:hypothetical protein
MPHLRAWRDRPADDPEPRDPAEYLFPRLAAAYLGIGRKPDQARAAKEFTRFLEDVCGFTVRNPDGRPLLGFHSLRHSHATFARGAGASVEVVQEQLGHSNAKVTAGYVHEDQATRRRRLVEAHIPLPLPGATAVPALPAPESAGNGPAARAEVLASMRARLAAGDVPEAARAELLALLAQMEP